jgi:hypothetical protein
MRRTQLSLVVLGILALAGGGTALAAKAGGGAALRTGVVGHRLQGPGQLLDASSSYLGIGTADLLSQLRGGKTLADIARAAQGKSVQGLVDAVVAAEKKALADAVSAHRLTQAQSDRIAQGLPQRTSDFVNGTFRGHGPPFGFRGRTNDDLQVAAGYLGTTVPVLLTQLMSGKSLEAIASATNGKSTSGLVSALVGHERSEHPQASVDELTRRVTQLVNGAFPRRPGGLRGLFGHGHRI